jgi:hypothetical protein
MESKYGVVLRHRHTLVFAVFPEDYCDDDNNYDDNENDDGGGTLAVLSPVSNFMGIRAEVLQCLHA